VKLVYLDWNATTPPLPEAVEAMAEVARTTWGNPASVHASGRAARDVVETAREALAKLTGASARDIIFTSGGTEANNLALHLAPALVTSRLEHPSVTRVADALAAQGKPVRWLPVPASGRLEPEQVREALAGLPDVTGAVVAVAAANHETGVLQPIAEIASITHQLGARLHVDAVQGVGKVALLDLSGADTFSLAAHKLRGPKGIGALVHRPERAPKPLLLGGSQERGRRPGTVDPVAAAGFRVAAQWASAAADRVIGLALRRDRLERALVGWGALVNGEGERLPHVSNVSLPGRAGDELVAALDLLGVAIASGSACSAGTTEASPIITSMLGVERARSAIRISLGDTTSDADVDVALAALSRVLRV
jgi:cysteine desulfurase